MTEDEIISEVARGIARSRSHDKSVFDEFWPAMLKSHNEMCAKYPNYGDERTSSLMHDAFRDARAALSALRGAGLKMATNAYEACALIAAAEARRNQEWATKYPDEERRCGERTHAAKIIEDSIRAAALRAAADTTTYLKGDST